MRSISSLSKSVIGVLLIRLTTVTGVVVGIVNNSAAAAARVCVVIRHRRVCSRHDAVAAAAQGRALSLIRGRDVARQGLHYATRSEMEVATTVITVFVCVFHFVQAVSFQVEACTTHPLDTSKFHTERASSREVTRPLV